MDRWSLIASVCGALFGSQVLVEWVKGKYLTKQSSEDSALKLIDMMTHRIEKLEQDLDSLRRENVCLHTELASLRTKLELVKPNV